MEWNWPSKITELMNNNINFIIATIVKTQGHVPRDVGTKMIIYSEQGETKTFGTIGGGYLEQSVIEDALLVLSQKNSKIMTYNLDLVAQQVCGGNVEVFLEVVGGHLDLYLFGAGHVGKALCRVLEGTPFDIYLVDEREDVISSDEISSRVEKKCMKWNVFTKDALWNAEKTYVVIMSHDHKHDKDIVYEVLKRDTKYIGLMGSKKKWETFKNELLSLGVSKQQISQIRCPIGDKNLGRGPAEIAIGIAAELLAISQ